MRSLPHPFARSWLCAVPIVLLGFFPVWADGYPEPLAKLPAKGFRLAFHPKQPFLVVAGETIQVFSTKSWDQKKVLDGDARAGFPTFSTDGRMLAISCDDGVRIWETGTWELSHWIELEAKRSVSCRPLFSPDGELLFLSPVGRFDALVFETEKWKRAEELTLPEKLSNNTPYTSASALSPSGEWLVVMWHTTRFWRLQKKGWKIVRAEPREAKMGDGLTAHVLFSPDGKQLVTIDEKGVVQIRRFKDLKKLVEWRADPSTRGLSDCLSSPDGTRLYTCSFDLRIWNAGTGELLGEYEGEGDQKFANTLAMSSDGKMLAVNFRSEEVWVFPTKSLGAAAE